MKVALTFLVFFFVPLVAYAAEQLAVKGERPEVILSRLWNRAIRCYPVANAALTGLSMDIGPGLRSSARSLLVALGFIQSHRSRRKLFCSRLTHEDIPLADFVAWRVAGVR